MENVEIFITALFISVAGLNAVARWLAIPYPIVLVLGGLVIGLIPGMPKVELDPDLVLVIFLPPLLYSAAFFADLRALRANARPISLLAIGLVLLTTVVVAVIGHELIDLPWAVAFALGAIVSPTDPIAATAIMRRVGAPRRIVNVIEGESLVNDGSGLVLYRIAVGAVLTGTFSVWEGAGIFVLTAVGGVAVGLAVGWVVRQVRARLDNPPAEVTISLLTGYFAFIPADLIGVSAVLATVTAGVYLGWYTPQLTTSRVRLQGMAVWEIAQYLLNALLFVLIGLQLPQILDALGDLATSQLIGWAVTVCLTVIALRFAWVFLLLAAPKRLRGQRAWWRGATFVSWAGMRGAVSLAAALALPLTTEAGAQFPGRDLIIFLTFTVILATLVVQGLTLPMLIQFLRLEDDGLEDREDAKARIKAAEAAIARLEELVAEDWVREDTAERMRGLYDFRRNRFRARLDGADEDGIEERSQDYQRLRRELLDAERAAMLELRRNGVISDDVMQRVQRDLDLEDQRLNI
jgi:CPA1 family monovalent cation:H+ antiporter